jgi:hypothetical protein
MDPKLREQVDELMQQPIAKQHLDRIGIPLDLALAIEEMQKELGKPFDLSGLGESSYGGEMDADVAGAVVEFEYANDVIADMALSAKWDLIDRMRIN